MSVSRFTSTLFRRQTQHHKRRRKADLAAAKAKLVRVATEADLTAKAELAAVQADLADVNCQSRRRGAEGQEAASLAATQPAAVGPDRSPGRQIPLAKPAHR